MSSDSSAFIWIASSQTFASFIEELEIVLGVRLQPRTRKTYYPSALEYDYYWYAGHAYSVFEVDQQFYGDIYEHFGHFSYVIEAYPEVHNPEKLREEVIAGAQPIFDKLKACQKYHLLLTWDFEAVVADYDPTSNIP